MMIKDIMNVLKEYDIITNFCKGVYILGDNRDYRLVIYDATQKIEGDVVEIWHDNIVKDTWVIGADGDILARYNQYNLLTMVDVKKNIVIDSSKIVQYLADNGVLSPV